MATIVYNSDQINQCIIIDEEIQSLRFRISELLNKKANERYLFTSFDKMELADKQKRLLEKEIDFSKNNCRDKIEYSRLVSAGNLSTEYAILSEKEVLAKNKKQQLFYIGIGAVVLLTSFYLISKK